MSLSAKIQNTEAALLELTMFFVRHSLPAWPATLTSVLEALRQKDALKALEHWAKIPLMGEYGLMQVEVSYINGYQVENVQAEQVHFNRLLEQTMQAFNNLRLYVRSGVNKPLIEIYVDSK
ncbi:MAG TPA: hypothetical protein PKL69_11935 [Agitococcus sp.]|nr:hypothetical protein [Agitococcus sp.]HNE92320.1 hypothetical protein [Agitococcus sp.]HNJ87140.1 hypothetical protein [Agitococcus sp.]HNL81036.1 hypothetical protein [Agitococcus sp.]HNP02921.1 hypothetical protein [Agitococcus sp.]